ncbi:MAG: DNA polymerase III subunit beta [Clostridiales bacterium]|nr:DNA polymerase III subunit beta [Clostridiales bacterium]
MLKISFLKEDLLEALEPAIGCVSSRNTNSSLSGVRITAGDGGCEAAAYDLEKGYRSRFDATVEVPGAAVIPAQKLNSIIRLMPEGDITLDIDAKGLCSVTGAGGDSHFELHTLSGEDFPALPDFSGDPGYTVKQSIMREGIAQTLFSAAVNDTRVALNGCFFKAVKPEEGLNGTFTVVASDSNRLSLYESFESAVFDEGSPKDKFAIIVPTKAVAELQKALASDGDKTVKVIPGTKHVMFEIEDKGIFFSRLIDTEYLDYNRFIPKQFETVVTLPTSRFLAALERASLVTEDRTMGQVKSAVKCHFEERVAEISSRSVTGLVRDIFDISTQGKEIDIGFNCRYLLDSVRACGVDSLKLSLISPLMSMIIESAEPQEGKRFLFLVLPVKMRE